MTDTIDTVATPENGFAAFNLPRALASSLAHMKYTSPTPVQAQAIPAALKGKDVLGSAQTGTGKTGAFLIPIIARLMTDTHAACLVMSPTRELAAQILVVARQMIHTNQTIKTALLIGGESMGRQRAQLSGKPRLIVGTPGRINDHLRERSNILNTVNMLVLDEADRMLDMGFTPQINEVLKHMTAPNRQTLMFSATFPKEIIAFTQKYMNDPVRVTIEPERTSAANIVHETLQTTEKTRYEDLMNELYNRKGSIILFIKTKHGADRMGKKLSQDGHSVDVIHGGLSQRQRDRAIAGFRAKNTRIMVATDVEARGLDVPHIEHVINYDLPQVAEDYVHRIGRTARNGQQGHALSFLMPSEKGKWNAIQRILNPGVKTEREPRGGQRSEQNRGEKNWGPRNGQNRGGQRDGQKRDGQSWAPRNGDNNNARKGGYANNKPRNAGHTDREFERGFQENEPNFNREGAGGEERFSKDNDRPFREQARKPHGKFFKKKKFFNKNKGPGTRSAA